MRIRNPIAAMRLKTENALAAGGARTQAVLPVILSQIERLDRLLRRLLSVTERDQPHQETSSQSISGRLSCDARGTCPGERITLERVVEIESARFDPEQVRHASIISF